LIVFNDFSRGCSTMSSLFSFNVVAFEVKSSVLRLFEKSCNSFISISSCKRFSFLPVYFMVIARYRTVLLTGFLFLLGDLFPQIHAFLAYFQNCLRITLSFKASCHFCA